MFTKKVIEFSDFAHDLVNRLTKQLKANENDVKFLWKRGNDLLFARNLADQRVQLCWEVLRTHVSANADKKDLSLVHPDNAEVLFSDIWLAETKYSIASARLSSLLMYISIFIGGFLTFRLGQVNEECNKQLKKIFSLGKDLESKRLGLVTRAAGHNCFLNMLYLFNIFLFFF